MLDDRARKILLSDSGAGALAATYVLLLFGWLVPFYGLAPKLLSFIGLANFVYATFSGYLAFVAWRKSSVRLPLVDVLIVANSLWAGVCVIMLVLVWHSASVFGLIHIALEGLFVAVLAVAEFRYVRPACLKSTRSWH